jgi:hypothetical protein
VIFAYSPLQALNAICSHSDYEEALSKFKITPAGWTRIQMILEILSVCILLFGLKITSLSHLPQKAHTGQQLLSAASYPTLYNAIPALEYLQTEWEKLQKNYAAEADVWDVLQAGLDKLAIYYHKMEASGAYGNAMSEFYLP